MILLYHLFLFGYSTGIRLISPWNTKAGLWIRGRKDVFQQLRKINFSDPGKTVWMHSASLGEFEQGRPVLQKLKETYPGIRIIITFFSPSGYEIIKKNKEFPDVFYLPMDSAANAKKFLDIVKPTLVLWVKYEYWHYYLKEIKKRDIPLLMVSGIYRTNQVFFKWYGEFYRNMLKAFTHFFVQNISSEQALLQLITREKITITGDTRCDRVIDIAENFTEVKGIAAFCGDYKVIVAGSTWEDDEAEWIHYVKQHPEIKFIIAPHEIDEENLLDVQKNFPGSIFYSEWIENKVSGMGNQGAGNAHEVSGQQVSGSGNQEPNCIIIDNIGMLSRLYYYATITYVGGGFGDDGLHNILEAAVYGKPVIFGPEHDKNFEAQELIDCSGAICIENAVELEQKTNQLLNDENELMRRGKAARNYIYSNAGASKKILKYIQQQSLI